MKLSISWIDNTCANREMYITPDWPPSGYMYQAWRYESGACIVKIVRKFSDSAEIIANPLHPCDAFAAVPIPDYPNKEVP